MTTIAKALELIIQTLNKEERNKLLDIIERLYIMYESRYEKVR